MQPVSREEPQKQEPHKQPSAPNVSSEGMPTSAYLPLELFIDLYELTMVHAYWREEMFEPAVFTLSSRELPPSRNFLLSCGVSSALDLLEQLRFGDAALEHLERHHGFEPAFLDWLAGFRFTGQVRAVPEGTPLFGNEPLLELEAPLPDAQLVETLLLNRLHAATVLASKGARCVLAAEGRRVVDFGMRRTHGIDAALVGARALYIAGVAATSNVAAGYQFGIPVVGTMAHSYIQAHDGEMDAYRAFAGVYPETVLLVDTYDSRQGVRRVIELARELGDAFRVRGIRLDSGDLGALASTTREMLDAAGLPDVRIVVSGGLDEHEIARLVREAAPIDTFAIGTAMGTSADAPALDLVYKLAAYASEDRIKLSSAKSTLPGSKQLVRTEHDGEVAYDTIALHDESLEGRPLLRTMMRGGRRTAEGSEPLADARRRTARELAVLPRRLRGLEPTHPFDVRVSEALAARKREAERRVLEREHVR